MDIEELKTFVDGPQGNLLITDEEFDEAADMVKAVSTVTDNNRLQLYGLYKQVTVGDVNTARPWGIDFVGCAKWDAWKGYSGWDKDKAKLGYVTVVRKLCGNGVPGEDSGGGTSGDAAFAKSTSTPADTEGTNSTPWSSTEGLFAAIVDNDLPKAREILDGGGSANVHTAVEDDSMTPLHYAADRGHVQIAQLLLQRGALVDAVDAAGSTALMNAVLCGHEEMVRVLLDAGADVTLTNADGETATSMLDAQDGAIAALLQVRVGAAAP